MGARGAKGARVRASELLRVPVANALAFAERRSVWMTEKAFEGLTYEENVLVFLHELGHFADRGRFRAPVLSRAGSVLLVLAPVLAPEHPFVLLGVVLTVPLAARWFGKGRAKSKAAADAHAHLHGEDGVGYARALEKLYQANLAPAVEPLGRQWVESRARAHMLTADVTATFPLLESGLSAYEAQRAVRMLAQYGLCRESERLASAYPALPLRLLV